MAKLNIYFNGKNYSINEDALATAIANLETAFETLSAGDSLPAGLYVDGVMTKSWDELVSDGIVKVEDGVVTSGFDYNEYTNTSASYLVGDLIIPDGVTSIGDQAFYDCSGLTNIVIPDSVTSIGRAAFAYCSITNIILGNNITSLGDSVFNNCNSLTSVVIHDGITNIPDSVFATCENLISITIPASVTNIGRYIIANSRKLVDITFNGTIAQCPSGS